MFPWAHFRQSKGAIKLHTLLDLRGNIPTFIHITEGKLADINTLDVMPVEPGAFYVMDCGYLAGSDKTFVFITNNFTLPPETVDGIYKQRWQVELFFRWIKQNLRIKNFYGTSENSVKTQLLAQSAYNNDTAKPHNQLILLS